MSMNKAMNGTIAYIEGRTDIAKETFRDPSSDIRDIPAILTRIDRAVDRAAAQALRNILKRALKVQPDITMLNSRSNALNHGKTMTDEALEEIFFIGVRGVEAVFEQALIELEEK